MDSRKRSVSEEDMDQRKKSRSEETDLLSAPKSSTIVSYLLEEGKIGPDGSVQPTTLQMTLKHRNDPNITQLIRLEVGQDVTLFQDEEVDDGTKWPPARIKQFREVEGSVLFVCQWFLSKDDITALPRGIPWRGPIGRQDLLDQMEENEIILSNQTDENEIGAILGLAHVLFHNDAENSGESAKGDAYRCRWQLDVSQAEMVLKPTPMPGGNNGSRDSSEKGEYSGSGMSQDESNRSDKDDDDDDDSLSDSGRAVVATEGEGSTLRESIEIGPEHQCVVPAFDPMMKHRVKSRNPQLIWKPGSYTDDELGEFLEGVAKYHTPYLDKNRLSNTASYTPVLGVEKLDKLLKHRPERLTGSSLSTASMLAGEAKRAPLRKECDADALLEILADANSDVQKAIDTAALDLARLTRAWTFTEKSLYNEGFRVHQGTLRKIAKTVAPVKSMQDVVDYHFRFKIPDQFRSYQEKKREIAVRIVECIEERRAFQPTAIEEPRSDNGQQHWSETSVQEVAVMTDARRRRARELMLDVQEQAGHDVLSEVAHYIRKLNQSFSSETRKALLSALDGHHELQQRFVDFLPN